MNDKLDKFPKGFLEKLRLVLGEEDYEGALPTFSEPTPTTFRVNTLKGNVDEVREEIEGLGFELESVAWMPEAFILRSNSLRELQETQPYLKGRIYVQNLSSMIPPLILSPEPGDEVLDLTAAPGSKTTQMVAMMDNRGTMVANDKNKARFYKLKANVQAQGVNIADLSMRTGEYYGKFFQNHFDKVLADVPCSSEGRFYIGKPKSFRYWKPAKVKEMGRKQKRLLFSAFQALKVGGTLVYSTCTFSPEENEWILSWAKRKFKEAIEIQAFDFSLPNMREGMTSWNDKEFDPSIANARRILPNDLMEGFFVAKILKKDTWEQP